MSNNTEDLITITLRKKKKKATDESEVMASADDENPKGAQSNDDKKYKIFISPAILEEMRRMRSRTLVVSRNAETGLIDIRYE